MEMGDDIHQNAESKILIEMILYSLKILIHSRNIWVIISNWSWKS